MIHAAPALTKSVSPLAVLLEDRSLLAKIGTHFLNSFFFSYSNHEPRLRDEKNIRSKVSKTHHFLGTIHLIHKWRNARKSLGRVHESEAKGASDSNGNKAEYGNAGSISCIS